MVRRGFDLYRAAVSPQGNRRALADAPHCRCGRTRLSPDDRGDRRFGADRFDRGARRGRLCADRHAALGRLQARALARHRADAAPARARRYRAAVKPLARHHAQRAVERAEHAVEFLTAAHDVPGGRNHAEGPLAAAELWILLDAVDRHFRGAAENRKHRAVFEEIDGVITPFAGGDFASIEPQSAVKFAPAERHFAGGGVRTMLAPAPRAWIGIAEIHTAPPLLLDWCHQSFMIAPERTGGKPFLRGKWAAKTGAA